MNITFEILMLFAWFAAGLLGIMFFIMVDMRGEEFCQDYFKKSIYTPWSLVIFAFIVTGPVGIIGITITLIIMKKTAHPFFNKQHTATNVRGLSFTCICYRFANIGIKKEG